VQTIYKKARRFEKHLENGSIGQMITALQLKERMETHPFRPFRICLSDGKAFEITNHDMTFVKRNSVLIGTDLDANSIGERFVECAIIHITRLEDLTTAPVA
jgi:hypothetical protein